MIKTFRGLLGDDSQDKIRLSTKKGKIGYRIHKFQLMFDKPGTESVENVVKIFKVIQSSVDGLIDFSDGNLLAASFLSGSTSATYPEDITTIFDQEIFNQDIYITHTDVAGANSVNYYLEVEVMSLTDNAAAVSTIRDIRVNPQVGA